MKHAAIAAFLTAAMIQGCAMGVKPECPMDATGTGGCSSMQAAYSAAQRPVRADDTSLFDDKPAPQSASTGPAVPAIGALSKFPEPDKAMPVFQQPKVYRPWLAPYVDADGVLHAGEYAYFSTPGRWNYGELHKPGEGSVVMGPAKPWDIGFVPREADNPNTPKTSAPPPPTPSSTQGGATSNSTQGGAASSNSIVQPYQRLN
jgi:hypothetical protein